uniref:inositol-3-phosphate synthase n=1 Tax=Paramuribaculum intestinale TaxID=2094151 RepID=UPI0025B1C0A6
MSKSTVKPAEGKLGVLVVGLGAVSSTFMTGVLMARKGLAKPVGSMTQYDKIRVGKGADKKYLKYNEIVPIADLNDIVFGAWDVYPANAYESAINCEVLKEKDINPVKDELIKIVPMKAAFDKNYAKRLDGDNVKDVKDRWDMTEQIREDIRRFKKENGVDRVVVLWAASTEVYVPVDEKVHNTLADLEAAMKADDKEHIAPSMCYAYAALKEGAPFIMGAPNTTVDIPAMWELSEQTGMPIAGKDFKTGQTLVKSGFAPIIGTRCLGLSGWFSTNILGNRDGLVLDEPANFRTKEVSKLSTLESILVPEEQPDLYTDYYHKVRINYYPPRNDNKEGWDNIDIFGWMGYPMEIKVNFLCRDSILAAPIALDLVLFSDLAMRAGMSGIQTWLSFFCKSPMHDFEHQP